MSCFVLVHIFHIEYLDLNEDINGEFYCFAMLFFIVEVLFSYCILSLSLSLCLSLSLAPADGSLQYIFLPQHERSAFFWTQNAWGSGGG